MHQYTILYDEPQEADWFKSLHSDLSDAEEISITEAKNRAELRSVLAYDRPDIILLDNGAPILVVEETVEVPSGHNVGQRFARIAAAAEARVPAVYFGPYVAQKHGGKTAGPRYMNVRLFHALDAMERVTGTAVTTINWPVDRRFEVRRDQNKDADMRAYMQEFFSIYAECAGDMDLLNQGLISSQVHERMVRERSEFVRTEILNPDQYDSPPGSVALVPRSEFEQRLGEPSGLPQRMTNVVLYNVGMTHIRSDPYTGMAILYRYLYVSEYPNRALILWFPRIAQAMWRDASRRPSRKDVRLYKAFADGIWFSDGFKLKGEL